MALTFGFYDSLNHDRLYNAQQMSAIFDGIINDGVFASVGSHFSVVPGTGMHVLVKSGRAWFNSTWTLNDSDIDLTIAAADTLLGRIDTVVLEVNSEQATRANSIKVVKGTAASSPVKPTLTNTATVHQHPLAHITVAKNTTAITASMIEIVVGKTDCPFVTAILQTTDITNLFAKWENDFQTWFSTVRSTLDEDVALNLQNQIDANWRKTLRETTPPKIGLASTTTPADMFDVLADVGNLHVWRKVTVSTAAGYTLGDVRSTYLSSADITTGNAQIYFNTSDSVNVSDAGNVSLNNPSITEKYTHIENYVSNIQSAIRGKFINIGSFFVYAGAGVALGGIFFVPSDAVVTYITNGTSVGYPYSYCFVVDKIQPVNGRSAGTTITYPVSTNQHAYQEGTDGTEKAAGYVLGEELTDGVLVSASTNNNNVYINDHTSGSLTVYDDGTVELSSQGSSSVGGMSLNNCSNLSSRIVGKFCRITGSIRSGSSATIQTIPHLIYVPSDATVSYYVSNSSLNAPYDYNYVVSKYQIVTGYPAIQAGNTVVYLNKLGNKGMTQYLSYVGTGTYGESSPNSISFVFPPMLIHIYPADDSGVGNWYEAYWIRGVSKMAGRAAFSTTNSRVINYATLTGNTFSWYNTDSNYDQLNAANKKYYVVAIG